MDTAPHLGLWLREFIAQRCRILAVVGLHPSTFKPHTGTKTSVLFVQKWNDEPAAGPLCPRTADYNIFFATQKLASKDSSGDKIFVERLKVSIFENDGTSNKSNIIKYDRDDFLKKYGTIKRATIYMIKESGQTATMSLEDNEDRFESLDKVEKSANMVMPIETKERLRDDHGHWIVQHDLFNHDGLTQDGIAEAFAEFAKKEKLSFF